MNDAIQSVVRGLELLDGALQSFIGQGVSAGGSALRGLIESAIGGAAFGGGWAGARRLLRGRGGAGGAGGLLSRGRGLLSSGRNVIGTGARATPVIGAAAAPIMSTADSISETRQISDQLQQGLIDEDEARIRQTTSNVRFGTRLGSTLAGAKLGAMYGGGTGLAAGGIGAIPGALLGATVGGLGGFFLGDIAADQTERYLRGRDNLQSQDATDIIGPTTTRTRQTSSLQSNYSMMKLHEIDPTLASKVQDRRRELEQEYFRANMQRYLENNPEATRAQINMRQTAERRAANMRASADTDAEYMNKINDAFGREVITVAESREVSSVDTLPMDYSNIEETLSKIEPHFEGNELSNVNVKQIENLIEVVKESDKVEEDERSEIVYVLKELLEINEKSAETQEEDLRFKRALASRNRSQEDIHNSIEKTLLSIETMTNNRLESVSDHLA